MGLPLFPSEGVAVLDTSSIIAIRESVTRTARSAVLRNLRERVRTQRLAFPIDVVRELERYVGVTEHPDQLLEWARACQAMACGTQVELDLVKRVLDRVPLLVDPDKAHDEADPYVVALAIGLGDQGARVVVVADDRRDKPHKTSIATACGIFRIPSLPLLAFLSDENIWRP